MPQPLDINTELARSVTVQRIQELADRTSLAAQHRHAQHAQQEQLDAETRVQEPPVSEQQPAVTDQHGGDRDSRGGADSSGHAPEHATDAGGAGELAVIHDASEQHTLDVTV
ncbi:MAG: hypothetical protein SGI88_00085 [Candidatus Hydrogenedentes bacterium]|nr:hypothetical protein [Candidatus Hydrogenedentota bacterium]